MLLLEGGRPDDCRSSEKRGVGVNAAADACGYLCNGEPNLAYTTLMTTLDRLYRKGMLLRQSSGRAFSYEVRCSRQHWLGELAFQSINRLLGPGDTNNAILSTFVSAVSRRDVALLDELDALVRHERERPRREEA
jgi:predicted transcriptional regulator